MHYSKMQEVSAQLVTVVEKGRERERKRDSEYYREIKLANVKCAEKEIIFSTSF